MIVAWMVYGSNTLTSTSMFRLITDVVFTSRSTSDASVTFYPPPRRRLGMNTRREGTEKLFDINLQDC